MSNKRRRWSCTTGSRQTEQRYTRAPCYSAHSRFLHSFLSCSQRQPCHTTVMLDQMLQFCFFCHALCQIQHRHGNCKCPSTLRTTRRIDADVTWNTSERGRLRACRPEYGQLRGRTATPILDCPQIKTRETST
ncbi:uncharacterized protein MYCFIDRAFT_209858, partial [Pseudocercospora fijiensis CIRAD86]